MSLPKEPPGRMIDPAPRRGRAPAAPLLVEGEKELRAKAAQNLVDWARTGRPTYVVVEGR